MKTTVLLLILLIPFFGMSQSRNTIQADFCQLGQKTISPRFSIEAMGNWALLLPKNLGIYWLVEFNQPVIKKSWLDKGYNLEQKLYLNFGFGLNYKTISAKFGETRFITAVGGSIYKSSMGPILGLSIRKEKISFEVIALYSVINGYKASYSEKFLLELKIKNQTPVYIRGFDPNSWWKASFSYSLNENLSLGIISERMYLTGLLVNYKISEKFVIRSVIGRNFIEGQNGLSLGISRSE